VVANFNQNFGYIEIATHGIVRQEYTAALPSCGIRRVELPGTRSV
jgi:hypothetical protein